MFKKNDGNNSHVILLRYFLGHFSSLFTQGEVYLQGIRIQPHKMRSNDSGFFLGQKKQQARTHRYLLSWHSRQDKDTGSYV
uniref:Uncharacterized protein n=1 Tax=Leclercia adecarboxylata TaxID=83655 RepID=A0A6H0A536_9ENTR|nr:hypothetical protein [Leclercia adecarboxylata]